jgi:hypothetical protein
MFRPAILVLNFGNSVSSTPGDPGKLEAGDQFLFGGFRAEFQNFARLASKRFADCFECRETDRLGFPGFEDGQVLRRDAHGLRQVIQPHFPLRQNDVEIHDDGHKLKRLIPVPPEFSGLHP